mgnify:FL=1
MPVRALLFDYGNTLVAYFTRAEQHAVLEAAHREVSARLKASGLLRVSWDTLWPRVLKHNKEADDCHVQPLIGRLARIYDLDLESLNDDLADDLCRGWLKPVFAHGRLYEDTIPALNELRAKGYQTAIVSNTPWGSPGDIWRGEIERHGLKERMDEVVFCTDCGWRKPARQIFEYTLDRLGLGPEECLFVGDDPGWDIAGPRAVGMSAVLVDRDGKMQDSGEGSISSLAQLMERL